MDDHIITTSRAAIGCILLFCITRIVRRLHSRFFHLQSFPGPKLAAWSKLWLLKTYASGNSATIFFDVNKTYGKIARIGPNHLLTNDPDLHWRILNPQSSYSRGRWFDSLRFDPHYPSIASEREVDKHDALRRKVSAGYNTRNYPDLEDKINEGLTKLIQNLYSYASHDISEAKTIDLGKIVRTMTLEAAAQICFSEGLEFEYNPSEYDPFWASIEEKAPYAQYLSVLHWMFSFIYTLTMLPALKEKLLLTENNNPGIGRIIKFSRIAVAKRFAPDAKPIHDMLGSWIDNGLGQHQAETEASIAVVTGAFPTAAAINVTLLYMVTNGRVLNKILYELKIAARKGQLSSPITYSEAMQLPYFQACITESLRLFPPITQLRERVVPSQGDTFEGIFLPGGTNIGLSSRALQYHSIFGPDPDVFRPERWLESEPEMLSEMRKIHAFIFGYGNTKCLGVLQACMIISKVTIELLRTFEIEIVNPEKPWVDQCNGVSFHKHFLVRLYTNQG